VANAEDWVGLARRSSSTSFFYLASDQWRYETMAASEDGSPTASGSLRGMAPIDAIALAARLGWQLPYPAFDRNPLAMAGDSAALTRESGYLNDYMISALTSGSVKFAVDDPDDPAVWPRVLYTWRADPFGRWAEGREHMLRHLLGAETDTPAVSEVDPGERPKTVAWREEAPVGKLDLLVVLDSHRSETSELADVILPLTPVEDELSSRDMHLYARSDWRAGEASGDLRSPWGAFGELARVFSELAASRLAGAVDLVAVPLLKDTPCEASQAHGIVSDWRGGDEGPLPGKTAPFAATLKRNFGAVHEMFTSLGPRVDSMGCRAKGLTWRVDSEVDLLRIVNGTVSAGVAEGRPSLKNDDHVESAILALSASTNGRVALEAFTALEERTGKKLADLALSEADEEITSDEVEEYPERGFVSPEWSGLPAPGRAYSAYALNVERHVPWRTLTGRIQSVVDHEWFKELGEMLPGYRPPLGRRELERHSLAGSRQVMLLRPAESSEREQPSEPITLKSREELEIWLSGDDAETLGISDGELVELSNRNGTVGATARAVPGAPAGLYQLYRGNGAFPVGDVLTRILPKPTHLVGGYSQLSYAPNYYGCMGFQRDQYLIVRPLRLSIANAGNRAGGMTKERAK
jgi:nitrate reductase alpha subunit